MSQTDVATPHPAYERMARTWDLAQRLLDGTEAMREAGTDHLPQYEGERWEDYQRRKDRSFLHPGYSKTIGTIASRPFSKPVALHWDSESPELPEPLEPIERNTDRQGTNLTGFAADVFRDAWALGLSHVLVDYPTSNDVAQTAQWEVHPYCVRIHPLSLTSWDSWTAPSGTELLTRINIRETATAPDGPWGVKEVEQYRVLTWDPDAPDHHMVTIMQRDDKAGWQQIGDPIRASYPGIPLRTFYTNRTGFMQAVPPLRAMMDLNVAHWQSSSDQRKSLAFARVAPIIVKGADETWKQQPFAHGQAWTFEHDVDVQYLEGTGVALQAGERDLQDIENKMEILGLQPLVERTSSSTATGKEIDASNAASDAQAAVERFEGFIRQLYETAADWAGIDLPTAVPGFDVDVFSEFGIGYRAAQDLPILFQLNSAGMLSGKTLLREVIRRGLLPESIDLETELEMASEDVVRRAEAFPGLELANQGARERLGLERPEDGEDAPEGDNDGPGEE